MSHTIHAWMMTAPETALEAREFAVEAVAPGDALVKVAGCGVCHTDLSFLHGGVKTRAALPLTLGHEISGTVEAVGEGVNPQLIGQAVLIPAVLPCGTCDRCLAGHRRICRNQIMPGNDRHGGFASHVSVPAAFLCPVPARVLETHELWELAAIADAVTTPFQAAKRIGLAARELALVVGVGGVGIHCVQIAAALGAHAIALDIDDAKLEMAKNAGANHVVNVRDRSAKEVRKAVGEAVKELGAPDFGWRIFETSGTRPGQETAFNLLTHGSALAVVGFTMDKPDVRLSNLMAFDAVAIGNWGCDPLLYPEVLEWIGDGKIQIKPFVKAHPLAQINAVFDAAHHGQLSQRAVLIP